MSSIDLVNVTGTIKEKNETSYTATYTVIADFKVGPAAVYSAMPMAIYDYYQTDLEFDTRARCQSITPTPVGDDGIQYTVTVQYGKIDKPFINPLDEPASYNITFSQYEAITDVDIYGNPIVNSAFDIYQDGVTRDDSRPILTVERNEATYSLAQSYYYRNTLNMYPFFGAPKGCVMLRDRSATQKFDANIGFFWTVSYNFEFNLDTFKKKIANRGMRELKQVGTPPRWVLTQILDEHKKTPITTPAFLRANGTLAPANYTPIINEHEVQYYADFSVFGL